MLGARSSPAIETHPQRQKIIDALLAGQSAQSIAKWVNPKLSHVSIWRYSRTKLQPELARASIAMQVLQKHGLAVDKDTPTAEGESAKALTSSVLGGSFILSRLSRKFDRLDSALSSTLESKDFDSLAKLESQESKALELTGRATLQPGFTNDAPRSGDVYNTVILLPSTPAQHQLPAGPSEIIDVEAIDE